MRTKITITAKDRIGRYESINIIVDDEFANKLITDDEPMDIINYQLDCYRCHVYSKFSASQVRRLKEFFDLLYHKFYHYSLFIEKA